jgi:hypothetical protein
MSECKIWKSMVWRRLCSGYKSVNTMYLYVQFLTDLVLHKYMHGKSCRMIVFYLYDLHRVQNPVLRDLTTCAEFFKWL